MNPIPLPARLLSVFFALWLWSGHSTVAETTEQEPVDRVLVPGDALLIHIHNLGGGLPEYREIVDSEGKIEMPYLGMLPAAGRRMSAVANAMESAYASARLSTNPLVHITYVARFDPPPNRNDLVRIADPRIPVPVADPLAPPSHAPANTPAPPNPPDSNDANPNDLE